MKVIDRQAAIDAFYAYPNIQWTTLDILKKINTLPSVDAMPAVRSLWVYRYRKNFDGTRYWFRQCFHCGYERNDDDPDKDTKFCPHCGAKMDGKDEADGTD